MTNKEKYKQAFSAIHSSKDLILEVNMNAVKKHRNFRPVVAALVAVVLLMGCFTVAYAADIGGIRQTIQLWIHGNQTDANIVVNLDGTYNLEYTDNDGQAHNITGGGTGIADDGSERPLSEDEIMEHLTKPEVQYNEDGSVWVFWYDQKVEITDMFEDGICYLQLINGNETLYLTIKYKGGLAAHPDHYVSPQQFSIGK